MKNIFNKLIILVVLLFVLSGIACAEDVSLDKIVVTPSRVEESSSDVSRKVDVITTKEMERAGAQNLADALTNLTSVNISNYGGPGAVKTIRMRGSTAAQVLVLIDGRPVNNPRDGEADLSTIPLDNIDKLEAMYGAGSSLYGSSAMGGVINIITKRPPKEGQKIELYSSFGTARTYVERMSYGAKVAKFGYLVNGGYESSQGFRENSELNAKDCNLKLEYELNNENNLYFNSGFYKNKVGTPGKKSAPDNDDKQATLKNSFDFNWRFKPDADSSISTKLYQNYDRLEFIENSSGSIFDTANSKNIHTTKVRGIDLQLDKQLFEKYRVIGGFNYVKNINDSTSTGKHEYIVRAGYLENHLDLLERLNLNLSVRLDDYSNFGTEVNPSLSLLYKFSDDLKLHGSVNRSFRAPTFNDLYWPDEGWAKGNPNVKPEKGVTGEIGADIRVNKYINSGLSYYHSDYNQLIQWSDDGSGVWQPSNVNSAVIDGIEFENKLYILERLEWNLDYTFLRAKDDKTHKYLVYQPKHKVDSALKYNDHKGLVVILKGQFTDKRFNDAANTVKVKRFYTIGLDVTKKIGAFTYFAYIDNLLAKKYEVINEYPMPGFSITGGLKAEF